MDLPGQAPAFRSSEESILRSSRPKSCLGSVFGEVPRGRRGVSQHYLFGRSAVVGFWLLNGWMWVRTRSVPLRDPELQGGGKPSKALGVWHWHRE